MNVRKSVLSIMFCLLYLVGCISTATVPNETSEKHLLEEGWFLNSEVKCRPGFQKVHFVAHNKSNAGETSGPIFATCLPTNHIKELNGVPTEPYQYPTYLSFPDSSDAED